MTIASRRRIVEYKIPFNKRIERNKDGLSQLSQTVLLFPHEQLTKTCLRAIPTDRQKLSQTCFGSGEKT